MTFESPAKAQLTGPHADSPEDSSSARKDLKDTLCGMKVALSFPVVLRAGGLFFVRGVQSLIHRSPNRWTLISAALRLRPIRR